MDRKICIIPCSADHLQNWYIASREPSDTPPDRNYLAFAYKGITSTSYNNTVLLGFYVILADAAYAAWGVLGSVQLTKQL